MKILQKILPVAVVITALIIIVIPENEKIISSEIYKTELSYGAESESGEYELADGEFIGEARGFKSTIKVAVTVENSEITDVEVVSHRDDRRWFNRANQYIPAAIINAQSADVDTVSGATYSSLGIINAVKDALGE